MKIRWIQYCLLRVGSKPCGLLFCTAPKVQSLESGECVVQKIGFDDLTPTCISGDCPPPVNDFETMSLQPVLKNNIRLHGYTTPTFIQKYAIPPLLAGRDVMACAQTGSGKTAAYLLPILDRLLGNQCSDGKMEHCMAEYGSRDAVVPYSLILEPTRELVRQVFFESLKFATGTPIKIAMLHGGSENYRDQISRLRMNGGNIVVATPGRLNDVINQNIINLTDCSYLVVDEADRMLNMGFEPQVRQIVQRGNMPPASNRQTMMFSATFPRDIQNLAKDFMKPDHVYMEFGELGCVPSSITQKVLLVDPANKLNMLLDLLRKEDVNSRVLVFVQRKLSAANLFNDLQRNGFCAVAIHGEMTQRARQRSLAQFKKGVAPVLVATAVAARGLDIPNVKHVINYELPQDVEEYIHRVGRTGRVGQEGLATSFYISETDHNLCRDLIRTLKQTSQEIPDFLKSDAELHRKSSPSYRWVNAGKSTDLKFNLASEISLEYFDTDKRLLLHGEATDVPKEPYPAGRSSRTWYRSRSAGRD